MVVYLREGEEVGPIHLAFYTPKWGMCREAKPLRPLGGAPVCTHMGCCHLEGMRCNWREAAPIYTSHQGVSCTQKGQRAWSSQQDEPSLVTAPLA